jgi:UDP-N-acetylmuramoyl-tripeptide--D-alanyl-D-alanine ligase
VKISEILKVTKGRLLSGDPQGDIDPASISTDSRTICPGEFFLPLKGVNFNGEEYIESAFKKGAIGAFTTQCAVSRIRPRLWRDPAKHEARPAGRGTRRERVVIQVKNTTDALGEMARWNRLQFRVPVIGVTGSNGKTTTKDMIAKVLSSKFNVLKNEGTRNNRIGVGMTLLKLNSSHHVCVIEMGTNHRGEIRLLAGIAMPTIAVITNIGPSHLKFLKDLKGVFNAKREIFEVLKKNSLVLLNGDDEYLSTVKGKRLKIMRFGFNENNDFRASGFSSGVNGIRFILNGRSRFELNLLGAHNIYNALGAIAAAYNFDISYPCTKKALLEYSPPHMRLNVKRVGGVTVINDAYNSNPLSMKSALEALKDFPGRSRWIVSADMLELGEREKEFHGLVGETIAKSGFDGLITFGDLSMHTSSRALECGMGRDRVWHCSSRGEAADILNRYAKKGDCILVKGSRSMKMEEVVAALSRKL